MFWLSIFTSSVKSDRRPAIGTPISETRVWFKEPPTVSRFQRLLRERRNAEGRFIQRLVRGCKKSLAATIESLDRQAYASAYA